MKLVTQGRVWARPTLLSLLLVVALHGPELGASPPIYRITDIGSLGGDLTSARAVNSSGHVVGTGRVSIEDQDSRAFYWDGVTITDIGTLGGPSATAFDINDSGIAIGSSSTGGGPDPEHHAFLWDGELMEDLGTLGGRHSTAVDINNSGQVAGSSSITGNDAEHEAHDAAERQE